jgi:hypothetical protein
MVNSIYFPAVIFLAYKFDKERKRTTGNANFNFILLLFN